MESQGIQKKSQLEADKLKQQTAQLKKASRENNAIRAKQVMAAPQKQKPTTKKDDIKVRLPKNVIVNKEAIVAKMKELERLE